MIKLTVVEATTLLDLLLERKEEGSYYGNREQYNKRIVRLIEKLKAFLHAEGVKDF